MKNVFGRIFGNHQRMTRHLRHHIHEREGIVVFEYLKRGGLAAQNFGENISVIVGHKSILSL